MYRGSDHRPTQAIVDLAAIRHNVDTLIKQLNPYQELHVSVKADAYGHGAVPVSRASLEAGATGLLVATVDEGIELREAGIHHVPIMVMGLTDPLGIAELIHYQLTVTVTSLDFFKLAYEQLESSDELYLLEERPDEDDHLGGAPLKVHLSLDTGMGRIGLRDQASIREFAEGIQAYPWVEWQGVFTHIATAAGGPEEYIHYQMAQWEHLLQAVPESVKTRHFANSGMGLWHNDQYQSDIVRAGVCIYGIDPKDNLEDEVTGEYQLAMELISELVYVKQLPAGSKISYGATYTCEADEWIGTVPIGYADGWVRAYAGTPLLVNGYECPVVGVINMDQLMIRLPHEMLVGTTVTLIGHDGGKFNSPSDIALAAGTIGYEIVTCLTKRIPRIYLNE